jgi:hypothetical protein
MMGTRILIQVAAPGDLPQQVHEILQRAGATNIRPSHPELPGLFTAVVPSDLPVESVIDEIKQIPGVRHVEPDQMRGAL